MSFLLILSCKNAGEITITKVEGSTEYKDAKLSLKESFWTEEGYLFSFDLENYELDDERPYTYDEYNSWNSKGYKSWIDFIFYQKTEKIKITDQNIFRPKMQYEKSTIDLADHYQTVLEAVIY